MIFTRFHMPNGRQTKETIQRPHEVEALAAELVAAGCRFDVEMLRTGQVSLTVEGPADDEGDRETLAIEIVPNDATVPDAVDRIVREASDARRGAVS